MTTTYTTPSIPHIAGSAFGLMLESETCPISDPTLEPVDTADWGVELVLVGRASRLTIPGVWVSSLSPWVCTFAVTETTAWPVGDHEVRLAYLAPGDAPRTRYEQKANLVVEVSR